MNNRIKFSELRELLLGMGFSEAATPEAVVFGHRDSDTLFVFPPHKPSDRVPNHNLSEVKKMLDARGFMSAEAFESQFKKTPA